MKRKILIILFSVVCAMCLALGLTACGNGTSGGSTDGGQNNEQTGNTDDGGSSDGDSTGSGSSEHEHNLAAVGYVEATCTTDGNIAYWYCDECDKYYSDAEATAEISLADTVIEATGHDYDTENITWTWSSDYSLATATLTCKNDSSHTEEITATVTSEVTTAAICTADGETVYTATVTFEGSTYTDEKTVTTEMVAHTYGDDNICTVCGHEKGSSEGLAYSLSTDETYYIVSGRGTCTDTDIVIPSTYNDIAVTSIGERAFYNCTWLTSITIPDNITSIGNYAFYYCTALASVNLGNGIETISSCAFDDCTSLASITIPDSVTTIGSNAFCECTSLTSVTIGSGVTSIGDYAFGLCASLTSITIPNSVETIGNQAFRYCASLISVTIGDSVTSIADYAFENCDKLVEIYNLSSLTITTGSTNNGWVGYYAKNVYTATSGSSNLTTQDGYIFYNDNGTYYFMGYSGSDTELTVPTLTVNGEKVSCKIYQYAFYSHANITNNNTKITSVSLGDSVTSIGDYAFYGCTSLTSVTIGNNVTSIGSYAFMRCTSLTSVTIPNSVTSIGSDAFNSCTSLTSVTIPDSITSISTYAFQYCTSLESITIPDNVTSIGQYAFGSCTSLTSITIPDSVTSIGNYAFQYCTSLESITIGSSVTSIGNGAFNNTAYYNDSSNWTNSVLYIDTFLIVADTSISGSYTIIEGTTTIADYAFNKCTSLTSVTICNSVTSIGVWAFGNCTALTEINFNATAMNSLSSGGYSSGNYVFAYAGQSGDGITVTIGANVTKIPAYLFASYYAPNITSVVFEDNSVCTSIGNSAFSSCTSLTSITIPDSVTSIGDSAFNSCTSLTSVTIGSGVISIGTWAFQYTSLESVNIPDSVETISSFAFAYCTALTSVTIGNGIKTISGYAFYDSTTLTTVYYNGTADEWSNISGISSSYVTSYGATIYYYSASEPDYTDGYNYWHYVDGEIVVWKQSTEE